MRKIITDKRIIVIISIILLLSVALLFMFQSEGIHQVSKSPYANKRIYKYSFTVSNPGSTFIEEAGFWTYSPIALLPNQKLLALDASLPIKKTIDQDGNETLNFTVKNIPPFGAKVVTVTAELAFSKMPNSFPENDLKKYLTQDINIKSEDPRIIALSQKVSAADDEATLANILKWITENITDSGFVERDHGALYALEHKRGDCTEFMNLFIALARASNIPARGIAGYVYPESAIMRARDYHNWVEVYLNGTWRIIDPLKNGFLVKENHYIGMRILGAAKGGDNTQRFFGSSKVVRISMD